MRRYFYLRPIEVAVTGPNLTADFEHARKIRDRLAKIPTLRDLQFGQSLDYPTVEVSIDDGHTWSPATLGEDFGRFAWIWVWWIGKPVGSRLRKESQRGNGALGMKSCGTQTGGSRSEP